VDERTGPLQSWQLAQTASDAMTLQDFDLAEALYKQILQSNGQGPLALEYLSSLAGIERQKGQINLAKQYRLRADELERKYGRPSMAGTGGGGGGAVPSSESGTRRRPSPWDPPETPGTEGATLGARPRISCLRIT